MSIGSRTLWLEAPPTKPHLKKEINSVNPFPVKYLSSKAIHKTGGDHLPYFPEWSFHRIFFINASLPREATVLQIGFLNLSCHKALLGLCEKDPFLGSHLHPVATGSTRRIARGILKGWLDGGLLPLPFAHVLARWQKGICAIASIGNTGSAIVTPGSTPLSDFRKLREKRILFSCIGSMEYLLTHRLFQECGINLSPDADPHAILAEQMALDLIPEALRFNPQGSIGAAVLEEPALSDMLNRGEVSQLMHCHDLWPEYTGAVLVIRNTDDPARMDLLNKLASHLTMPPPNQKTAPEIPIFKTPCRADFLTTGRYLDSRQLSPMIASLL